MSSFLLSYDLCGIRFNVYMMARDWADAKSKAPKAARNINAEWMP